jgi:hypothetical protein
MKEIDLGGIYIAPFALDLVIALVIYFLIRRFFPVKLIEQKVWHPQLFHLCVYAIILSIISLLN